MPSNRKKKATTASECNTSSTGMKKVPTASEIENVADCNKMLADLGNLPGNSGFPTLKQWRSAIKKAATVYASDYNKLSSKIVTLELAMSQGDEQAQQITLLTNLVDELNEKLKQVTDESAKDLRIKALEEALADKNAQIESLEANNKGIKEEMVALKTHLLDQVVVLMNQAAKGPQSSNSAPLSYSSVCANSCTTNNCSMEANTHTAPKLTHSQVAQNPRSRPPAVVREVIRNHVEEHVVVIKPTEGGETKIDNSAITLKRLEAKVSKSNKIRIKKHHLRRHKAVVIECTTAEESAAVRELLEGDVELQASMPKKVNPTVQILGVPKYLSKQQVLDNLRARNRLEDAQEDDFEVKAFIPDSKGTRFVVIQTKPKVFRQLMEQDQVFIESSNPCQISQQLPEVVICGNCCEYCHKDLLSNPCKRKPRCSQCAGEHLSKDCPNLTKLCCCSCLDENQKRSKRGQRNLLPTDHSTLDLSKCPKYQHIHQMLCKQVQYV